MKSILALSVLFLSASVAVAAPRDDAVPDARQPAASVEALNTSLDALKADVLERTLSEATTHVLAGGTSRTNLRYDLAIASFEKATALYDEVQARDLPAEHKRQLLLTLETLGDLYVTTGDLDKARASFLRQQTAAKKLLQVEPDNPAWQASLSVSYLKFGDVARDQGDTSAALDAFLLALEQDHKGVSTDDPEARARSASAHLKAGVVKSMQGDPATARHHYEAGLRIAEKLVSAAPGNTEWQQTLAMSHFLIGNLLANDHEAALAAHQRALDIRSRLAQREPAKSARQLDLAESYDGVGVALREQEKYPAAVEMFEKAHSTLERLAETDPQNMTFQHHLAFAKAQLAEAMFDGGKYEKYDAALAIYRHSATIRERLAAEDRANAGWQSDLAVTYDRLAGMLVANFVNQASTEDAEHDNTGALAYYRQALSINQKLAQLDPDNLAWQQAVRSSHRLVGWMCWRLQGPEQGLVYLRTGRDFIANAVAARPTNEALLTGLLVANNDIGEMADRSGDAKAALAAYTDSLVVARQLVGLRPNDAKRLRGVSLSANIVGDRFLALRREEEALAAYREGIASIETAIKANPDPTDLLRDLALGQNRSGDALMQLGRRGEAMAAYLNGLEATERLIAAQPDETQWRRDLEFGRRRLEGAL